MTTKTAEPLLSESEVERIAARKPNSHGSMVNLPIAERDALIRDWRAMKAALDALRDSASLVAFQAHQIDGQIADSLIDQGAKLQREADAKLVENYHECPSTNDYNIAAAIRANHKRQA